MKFTEQQLDDWKAYEEVRQGGLYNMFDVGAREETGLDPNRYFFVMKNYADLKEAQ